MATVVLDPLGPNLSDWIASKVEDSTSGRPLHKSGPVGDAVLNVLGSEDRASTLIANTFWQSYVRSPAFRRDLERVGVSPTAVRTEEILVVPHGNDRFALMLTDPELGGQETRSFNVAPRPAELRKGWDRSDQVRRLNRRFSLFDRPDRHFPFMPFLAPAQVLTEIVEGQTFSVVVAPSIEEELTHIPTPHMKVSSAGNSTAGVYVQDALQRVGVTAAEHAVPQGQSVTVDGLSGKVVSRDTLTDSCFIEVSGIVVRGPSCHGPLRLAPRQHETVTFEGYTSGSGVTKIVAWNYELPYIDPNLQQTVRTDLITAQGDSGAALVDSSSYVVGFAHSRSSPSAVATYSSWIWADAVLQKHSLTIY